MIAHRNHRRGITMAETIVSTLLVGMVLVGTIQLVAPIIRSGSVMSDKLIATNMARELSEEIGTKLFMSPSSGDVEFTGPEAGETRAIYDDIDDFHGINNSPPVLSDGRVMTHLGGWARVVKVTHASLADPSADSGIYTGLKRVTVSVTKDGVTLATDVTIHAHAADRIGFVNQEP
jgi:MSHA pilin protein MshD